MRFTNPTTQIVALGAQLGIYYAQPPGGAGVTIVAAPTTGSNSIAIDVYDLPSPQNLFITINFYADAAKTEFTGQANAQALGQSGTYGPVFNRTFIFPMLSPYWNATIRWSGGGPTALGVSVSSESANVTLSDNGVTSVDQGAQTYLVAPNDTAQHQALAANFGRLDAALYNESNQNIYILLSGLSTTAVSSTNFTVLLVPGAYFELPKSQVGVYRSVILVAWAVATAVGGLAVTEYS